uniref:Uncharacterized protein n=1 Tax=Onchocerca volvulus TaxID=6282 RepID=A0A8R1XZX4_ONCVO
MLPEHFIQAVASQTSGTPPLNRLHYPEHQGLKLNQLHCPIPTTFHSINGVIRNSGTLKASKLTVDVMNIPMTL